MHSIPYRTKLRIRAAIKISLIVLAVLAVLFVLSVIFLERYVVYDENGAHIDLKRSTAAQIDADRTTEPATDPLPEIELIYGDPSTSDSSAETLSGYYIDIAMLQKPSAVLDALKALDGPCTVMIDLKSSSGSFYYSTGIEGAVAPDSVDVSEVDAIISYLRANGFHMIARVQAFRDTNFALNNIPCGIAMPSAALWMDSGGYFWIDPENSVVRDYLKQIVSELASKGFREVVFDDFYYPESYQIDYTSEKTRPELMQETAKQLISYFGNSNIRISFGNPSMDFVLEQADSHVYLDGVDGSGVGSAISSYSKIADAERQLVFLTGSRDTRFEGYNLLRPLI